MELKKKHSFLLKTVVLCLGVKSICLSNSCTYAASLLKINVLNYKK